MQITASLKLTTPLHISMPDALRYDVAKNQTTYREEGTTPLISTQSLQIVNPAMAVASPAELADDLPDDEGDSAVPRQEPVDLAVNDGGAEGPAQKPKLLLRVPAIMANNLVGHLRRHAAHHVLQALAARGQTVSLPVYSCLQCGAWTGSPDGSDLRYEEFVLAKKHPYLGLFGGGPRMIRRSFQTRNALPALQSLRDDLQIPYCGAAMPDIPVRKLTQIAIFRRNDDLDSLVNLTLAAKTLKDFETSLLTYQAAVRSTGGMRSDAEKKVNAKVSSMTFSSMEFVIPGTAFDLAFDLFEDLTPAQTGLFLLSLDRFAETDTLGGHARNGFGRFVFTDVAMNGESIFRNGRLNPDHAAVQPYLQAWVEAGREMSVSELEYLFRVGAKKAKAKPKNGEAAKPKNPELTALDNLIATQQGDVKVENEEA